MTDVATLRELLKAGRDDAIAIAAPDRRPLTYRALRTHVERTVAGFNRLGVGRNDRVADVG